MQTEAKKHKFEIAGLGNAPFRFIGFEVKTFQACPDAPIQVGGSCDYCGTGITNHFHIESADGKRSKVGSSCIKKVGDAGLMRIVKKHERAHKAKLRKAREEKLQAKYNILINEKKETLASLPHPNEWFASQGNSLLDYWEFVRPRSESSLRGAIKAIETI